VLDDRDLQVRIAQAEAALEYAQANLATAQASFGSSAENVLGAQSSMEVAAANVEVAEVRARRAEQDFNRYDELIKTQSVTQQQFDQAQADRDAAAKQLEALKRQREATSRQAASLNAQKDVSDQNIALARTVVKQRQADLDFAKLQASYAYIIAPSDGVISRKSVEVGQLVQAGQSLFALVNETDKWVVANFKETQLEKMKPGQGVEIVVDAFPHEVFMGKLESISPATGARFALLPADNASGNFIKVVQRIPVKIILTVAPDKAALLRAGMNVIVDVHIN
jgi:membrane fusion protein, multidrug efflux system